MAASTCAKCGGHAFQRGLITPLGEQHSVNVLQCSDCGTVVGILDLSSVLDGLQKQIAAIDAGLVRVVKALSEL